MASDATALPVTAATVAAAVVAAVMSAGLCTGCVLISTRASFWASSLAWLWDAGAVPAADTGGNDSAAAGTSGSVLALAAVPLRPRLGPTPELAGRSLAAPAASHSSWAMTSR